MAFNFDELTRKAKDVANKAADRTKDAAELVKLNMAIAGEQKEIAFTEELSNLLYDAMLAREADGSLMGYVRLLPAGCGYEKSGLPTFGRLAVKKAARKQGLGGELVRRACRWLLEESGGTEVEISAMAYLEKFYRELGFVTSTTMRNQKQVL